MSVIYANSKDGAKEYYQVSFMMETEETRKREFGVYEKVTDNYPKFVLSLDKLDFTQNGIRHMSIIDFLLSENTNTKN